MFNLSPLKYSRVLVDSGGPIERLGIGHIELRGKRYYQANSWLREDLKARKMGTRIYTNCDGTGVHASKLVASHIAISEALERWALHALYEHGPRGPYGLEIDPTSLGMAAYPGSFVSQARSRALLEAVERYCLVGWWDRKLGCKRLARQRANLEAIEIENPLSRDRVVVVWLRRTSGRTAYGFAAAGSLKGALRRAELEMERSALAIKSFFLTNPGFLEEDIWSIENPMERRVIYFSLHQGHQLFCQRAREAEGIRRGRAESPRPLINCHLPGPWDKYTTVWRVLFPMTTSDYLGPQSTFFFW